MNHVTTRLFSLLALILLLSLFVVHAAAATPTVCAHYFYGDGCAHCAKVEPVLAAMERDEAVNLTIVSFEVYRHRENLLLLNQYFDAYGVPNDARGVPALFLNDQYALGDTPILSLLKTLPDAAESGAWAACPTLAPPAANDPPGTVPPSGTGGENTTDSLVTNLTNGANVSTSSSNVPVTPPVKKISLVTLIGAALVDSINPCAIAVLLILLGALLATGNKRRAIIAGISFTIAIYIAYFLFGLGLFSVLRVSGLTRWFSLIVGIIAILIGLANIKDFFWYARGGFVMEIPRAWRPTLKRFLGAVTSPLGAFLMGFVVCLFELPCTGGPYFFILGLLAERSTMAGAIPLLLLYNLFFVFPLLLLTAGIAYGYSSVESASSWKDRNIRVLHLVAGLIMLSLGILVLTGIL